MDLAFIPITICIGFFAMVAFIAAVINSRRQTEVRSLAEVQNKLLDKFGSSKEFVDFLQADGGKTFLSPMPTRSAKTPGDKIIFKMTIGIIVTMVGLAFVGLAIFEDRDMAIAGVLLLAGGLGFLISSILSYRLSRAWGMIGGSSDRASLGA